MKVEHTPLNETVSSVFTYSCLLDSRTKLPLTSFRWFNNLYDLNGKQIPRTLTRRDYLPFFALEDSYKYIRSDGAYSYDRLSGEGIRKTKGEATQVVESGVFYPPDSWTNGVLYQPYGFSLAFAQSVNEQMHTTPMEWINRAIVGEIYKPTPESRWTITGGVIPDVVATPVTMPSGIQDYLDACESGNTGHIVWAFGTPDRLGLYTFHPGSYNGPTLETLAGTLDDESLKTLSSYWVYPEAKQHEYYGYMGSEINFVNGVRLDFRSTHAEEIHSKRGPIMSFDWRFPGWYNPIYEVSVGTPGATPYFVHDELKVDNDKPLSSGEHYSGSLGANWGYTQSITSASYDDFASGLMKSLSSINSNVFYKNELLAVTSNPSTIFYKVDNLPTAIKKSDGLNLEWLMKEHDATRMTMSNEDKVIRFGPPLDELPMLNDIRTVKIRINLYGRFSEDQGWFDYSDFYYKPHWDNIGNGYIFIRAILKNCELVSGCLYLNTQIPDVAKNLGVDVPDYCYTSTHEVKTVYFNNETASTMTILGDSISQ